MTGEIEPHFIRRGFGGQEVPFYGLTFDKRGTCTSPKTRDAVIARIASDSFTDTIFYSHGWNNDWKDATSLYSRFLEGLGAMADNSMERLPSGIKPLFIGVAWPSAALVWPWEEGPELAAGAGSPDDPPSDSDMRLEADIGILAGDMDEDRAARLEALASGQERLTRDEVAELARLLAPELAAGDPEEDAGGLTAGDLAKTLMQPELRPENGTGEETGDPFTDFGTAGGSLVDAEAAGLVSDVFGLRKVIRLATVLKMKDRAGVVGRAGVADTLTLLTDATGTRLHLVGHSYGAKVVMSALCAAPERCRAASALLLQPAVNHLAFAPDVDGRVGGFRKALARTEKPLLVTHSKNDFPLRRIFHLAVRRKSDVGEEPMLAAAISRFAAMGGYGPRDLSHGEAVAAVLPDPGKPYPPVNTHRVVSLDGTDRITGHSRVTNPYTFWAMFQNIM